MARGWSENERGIRQQEREAERERRALLAAERAAERERKQRHIQECRERVELLNERLEARVEELESILRSSLQRSSMIDLNSALPLRPPSALKLGDRATPLRRPDREQYRPVEPLGLSALFGGKRRYAAKLSEAEEAYARAMQDYEREERQRQAWVRARRAEHAQRMRDYEAEVAKRKSDLAEWRRGLEGREQASVERYLLG